MIEAFYDKENIFAHSLRQKKKDPTKVRQRFCRKDHGIVDGLRDLSLVGNRGNSLYVRSSIWRSGDNTSLGGDSKSSASDSCDSVDDSCLWELYTGDGIVANSNSGNLQKTTSPQKSPNRLSRKLHSRRSSAKESKSRSPRQITLKESLLKMSTKKSPRKRFNRLTPKSSPKCPMEIVTVASDSILWELYEDSGLSKSTKEHGMSKSTKEHLKSENSRKVSSSEKISTCPSDKATQRKSMEIESSDSLDTCLWKLYTSEEKSKSQFISSPKKKGFSSNKNRASSQKATNIDDYEDSGLSDMNDDIFKQTYSYSKKSDLQLRVSTPIPSKSSSRKATKPAKSISPKDKSFKGISFHMTPSVKKTTEKSCSLDVFIDSKLSKGKLKRHSSMIQTSPNKCDATPLCKLPKRLTKSEPRPKRKLDVSIDEDSYDDAVSKKRSRCLKLEEQRPSSCTSFAESSFFTPLPNVEDFFKAGVAPIKYGKECASCGTNRTPLWRDAEDGTQLCNACGIRWKKHRVRCTRCWYIPLKDEKRAPYCSRCGTYNTVKRCNTFRRYVSSIY